MAMSGSEKRDKVDFNEALTQTGFGKFNIFLLLANGGCTASVILETSGMMFISPAAECDLNLTLTTKGYLASASFLGVVLGAHFWGFIADTKGRKKAIVISMFGSFVLTLISCLVPWDWLFILLRFLNGLFISSASSVVYAYCGEFHHDKIRPRMVSTVATFAGLANILLSGIAWLVLPYEWAHEIPFLGILFRPWRLLVLVYGLPSLISGLCILCIPESPKFLITQGKYDDALEVLRTMFKVNTGKSKEKFPVSSIMNAQEDAHKTRNVNFLKTMWEQTLCLFSKPLALKTFMVCTLQFGTFGMASGLAMWYPGILNQMIAYEEANTNQDMTMCNTAEYYNLHLQEHSNESLIYAELCNDSIHTDVFLVLIILGAIMVIAYLATGALINLVGKKNILVCILLISSAAGLTAQYISGSIIVKVCMALALLSITALGAINAIVVDMYSTKIRATALAISLMIGRIGTFVGSYVQGIIFYQLCNFMFPIYTAVNIVLIVIALALPTSTLKSQPNQLKL